MLNKELSVSRHYLLFFYVSSDVDLWRHKAVLYETTATTRVHVLGVAFRHFSTRTHRASARERYRYLLEAISVGRRRQALRVLVLDRGYHQGYTLPQLQTLQVTEERVRDKAFMSAAAAAGIERQTHCQLTA